MMNNFCGGCFSSAMGFCGPKVAVNFFGHTPFEVDPDLLTQGSGASSVRVTERHHPVTR